MWKIFTSIGLELMMDKVLTNWTREAIATLRIVCTASSQVFAYNFYAIGCIELRKKVFFLVYLNEKIKKKKYTLEKKKKKITLFLLYTYKLG